MKKFIYSAMAVAMLATTSCKDDFAESFVGEEATVEFSISTPEIGTRAFSEGKEVDHLHYAIYEKIVDGNNVSYKITSLVKTDDDVVTLNNGKATINVALKTGKDYQAIFWADDVQAPYTVAFGENGASMTVDYTNALSNDEKRDAFYASVHINIEGNESKTVTLTRPFAQLNIGTSDYEAAETAGYEPTLSSVTVDAYSAMDLMSGNVTGESNAKTFGYAAIPSAQDETFPVAGYEYLAMNYILVGNDKVTSEVTFRYKEGENAAEETKTVGSVPFQRNYRTNIYGGLLTGTADINVEIKPGYDGYENKEIVEVATATQLQEAIENGGGNGETIILTGDIDLSDLFGPNLAPTRAGNNEPTYYVALANGKELTIDLNGCKLSAKENSQKSFALIQNKGTLTIKDSKGNGVITFIAENNRYWNNYSSVISNQPGGKLIIEGGTIEHLGGTDMAYGIDNLTNGKGTYAETIINGGYVKSTYRAVRQFLNGVEAQNILTVNGGTIEGTNKSIWMQDPSAKANTGKLFVAANAQLKGDVYLFVTAGSTEWPVEVEIANAALQGESTVVSGNVPSGYSVIEDKGVWKVINAVAVTTADELVAELGNGYNVYFMNDIKIDSTNLSNGYGATGINQLNGGVIDGNGNDLSVNAWTTWDSALNTTGGTIKNLNVTGGMRGIFVNHNSTNNSKVILDNVVIDGTVYTISCDQGTNKGLEATNCTFNGWTSYATTIGDVLFTDCSFGKGQGYAFCRPYAPTTFVGCNFAAGYEIDARAAVTFDNCTVNGVALTAENLATLVTSNTANATVK